MPGDTANLGKAYDSMGCDVREWALPGPWAIAQGRRQVDIERRLCHLLNSKWSIEKEGSKASIPSHSL